ncbi:MAG: SGNH/GDSL hydrolase family protein, partial [Eubacteriales bacterium]|nr:SGNH/GDSL hydrolase family protein [Eubacteriales bacterium]
MFSEKDENGAPVSGLFPEWNENRGAVSGLFPEREAGSSTFIIPFSDRKESRKEAEEGAASRRTVLIGDSRTVGMQMYVPGDPEEYWSAKNSMGYSWMVNSGVPGAESLIGENTDVVILMGVNDLGNVGRYVDYMNQKAAEWKERGARTFFVSVTPVVDSKSPNAKNARIESFNAYAQENLRGVTYIDAYSRIRSTFGSPDGIHFDAATYREIYRIIHFYLYRGWYEEAGLWFYFDRGRPLTGWQYLDGSW